MFSYDVIADAEADSDLAWILSSGQASLEMAAEALLTAFYAPVYRLMFAWRLDPLAARRGAETVFVQALARLDRINATPDPEQWIYALALNVARQSAPMVPAWPVSASLEDDVALIHALQKLKPQDRWELLAYYGLDWTAAEIAACIEGPQSQIEARLRGNALIFEDLLPPDDQGAAFKSAFQRLWPAPDLNGDERQQLGRDVHARGLKQRAALRRSGRIKEWITIVAAVILAGVMFWVVEAALPVEDPLPGETTGAISAVDSEDGRRSAPRAALAAESPATPTPAAVSGSRRRIGPRFWTLRPGAIYFVQPGETIEGLAA
ncbi:MAG TPA: hypothetical protein VLS48_03045, partial [Anaerolineales bacterium]|nr:hypothetical protein [Anaerolineales bacterium]